MFGHRDIESMKEGRATLPTWNLPRSGCISVSTCQTFFLLPPSSLDYVISWLKSRQIQQNTQVINTKFCVCLHISSAKEPAPRSEARRRVAPKRFLSMFLVTPGFLLDRWPPIGSQLLLECHRAAFRLSSLHLVCVIVSFRLSIPLFCLRVFCCRILCSLQMYHLLLAFEGF